MVVCFSSRPVIRKLPPDCSTYWESRLPCCVSGVSDCVSPAAGQITRLPLNWQIAWEHKNPTYSTEPRTENICNTQPPKKITGMGHSHGKKNPVRTASREVKLGFILCSGSNRNVFYLYRATSADCGSTPCYAHTWLYKGCGLYGFIRTLQSINNSVLVTKPDFLMYFISSNLFTWAILQKVLRLTFYDRNNDLLYFHYSISAYHVPVKILIYIYVDLQQSLSVMPPSQQI